MKSNIIQSIMILSFTIMACSKNVPSEGQVPPNETATNSIAITSTPEFRIVSLPLIQVEIQETVRIENTSILIRFDEIIEDSRCPEDVECVWAGQAEIQITLWEEGTQKYKAVLVGSEVAEGDTKTTIYQGLKITLQDVQPYPNTENPAKETANVTLTIEATD